MSAVAALTLAGLAISAYYFATLAIAVAHIFTNSGEEPLASTNAALASVVLYFTLPLALLVYLAFVRRAGAAKEPGSSDCGWRAGVLAASVAGALISGILIDIFLLRNNGLFMLAGIPVLSRVSPLTAVLVPASFFFPLAILTLYTIGSELYSKKVVEE
jgi:hypothetical protein